MMKRKECTKCGVRKPFTDFCKHSKTPDGYQYWCKACHAPKVRADREAPLRTPSIDCRYLCKLCGIGYDTETEAEGCCPRR